VFFPQKYLQDLCQHTCFDFYGNFTQSGHTGSNVLLYHPVNLDPIGSHTMDAKVQPANISVVYFSLNENY
jgi:hypothetical protein